MSEPSERDREMANQYICNWINLYSAKDGKWHALESAVADAIAAARAEEACRIAKLSEELERWKSACRQSGICMSCAGGQSMQPCTDCLGTGWNGGAPPGYIESSQLHAARAEERERAAKVAEVLFDDPHSNEEYKSWKVAQDIAARIRHGGI